MKVATRPVGFAAALGDVSETVIVVSHDRAFMDAICTYILHVEGRTSEWYKGNYSQFVPHLRRARRWISSSRWRNAVAIK